LFFYNHFYVCTVWISTKPCITPAEGMDAHMNKYMWGAISLLCTDRQNTVSLFFYCCDCYCCSNWLAVVFVYGVNTQHWLVIQLPA
jgi:hypothetical protein